MNTATALAAPSTAKKSFKVQMLQARESAIIETVNRLLAEKGFEAMTVDEVAAEVGIAKASLYKHFNSKEELACAAMERAMQRAQSFIAEVNPADAPLLKLKAVTRWTMQLKLWGQMPSLPSQNSSLRATLMASQTYMNGLLQISDTLGGWIEQAQDEGAVNPQLPAIAVLYTLYARACDPVLEFLKMGNDLTDEAVLDIVMRSCFEGLQAR